jgi:hypothetical protein
MIITTMIERKMNKVHFTTLTLGQLQQLAQATSRFMKCAS